MPKQKSNIVKVKFRRAKQKPDLVSSASQYCPNPVSCREYESVVVSFQPKLKPQPTPDEVLAVLARAWWEVVELQRLELQGVPADMPTILDDIARSWRRVCGWDNPEK